MIHPDNNQSLFQRTNTKEPRSTNTVDIVRAFQPTDRKVMAILQTLR